MTDFKPYDPRQDLADLERDLRALVLAASRVVKSVKRSGDLYSECLLADLRDAVDNADAWLDTDTPAHYEARRL